MAHHITTMQAVRAAAQPLEGNFKDYDHLLALIGDRRFVLLGEASHGTHEFYRIRAQITHRLIEERGFEALAVEADWPDTYRLNRFVRGDSGESSVAAFGDFQRFPTWMWRNTDVLELVNDLYRINLEREASKRIGFYGIDLYSLYRSADAIINYLEVVDPDQATRAKRLYAALDHMRDPQQYGYQVATGLRASCRDAAVALLTELVRNAPEYRSQDGRTAVEAQFFAERNAYVVLHAEQYYRAMFSGRINTWNLRDAHMVDMLLALHQHLRKEARQGKIIVWAHNSHLGDARATEMGERKEWNVGQLLREQAGSQDVYSVGFTTYTGHVTAAREWNGMAERRWIRPARKDSYEYLFYSSHRDRFFLPLTAPDQPAVTAALSEPFLERAIGVLYRPESEYTSHYFQAHLARQFDAVFHLDETSAIEPFEPTDLWLHSEPISFDKIRTRA